MLLYHLLVEVPEKQKGIISYLFQKNEQSVTNKL